jgi:hypothetical protein
MATITPRINITTKLEVRESLIKLAKRDNVTISAKAAELLLIGLSIEEDFALVNIVKDRMTTPPSKYIKHDDVWK